MPKYRMYKDPEAFAPKLDKKTAGTMRFLGLDLGSNCGVAVYDYVHEPGKKLELIQSKLQLFQWDLSTQGLESGAARFVRLRNFLARTKPDIIAYEDVKYSPPKEFFINKKFGIPAVLSRVATASEVLGGMKVTVATWAEEMGLVSSGFAIATIKKYATGNGRAGKEDMIAAANRSLGVAFDASKYKSTGIDNVVDAAFILLLSVQKTYPGLPKTKQ
jgi:Holliday junction resolvasome RuvABC endonuclease subunit